MSSTSAVASNPSVALTSFAAPASDLPKVAKAIATIPSPISVTVSNSAPVTSKETGNTSTKTTINAVFVVGCGHSGTSVLLRTVSQLPGIHCPCMYESDLLLRVPGRSPRKPIKEMREWTKQTKERGFAMWAEKTPRHIHHVRQILHISPKTKVIYIYRNGKAVANSLAARMANSLDERSNFEDALDRWVSGNNAIEPYLNNTSRVFSVRYEDFANHDKVLGILKDIYSFLGNPGGNGISDERFLLSLAPLKQPEVIDQSGPKICSTFSSEAEKESELKRVLSQSTDTEEMPTENSQSNHKEMRASQMGETLHASDDTKSILTEVNLRTFLSDRAAVDLMRRFNYTLEQQRK